MNTVHWRMFQWWAAEDDAPINETWITIKCDAGWLVMCDDQTNQPISWYEFPELKLEV